MFLKRFYDDGLAQASYLLGCAATGEALVVDPNRDVKQYVEAAASEGLRVTHVTETHIHADFVSGSRELAQLTGAKLYLSDEGDVDWKYQFAEESGAVLVKTGDSWMVGNLKIEVMHTPGHTPEHISFIVTDTPATDKPIGVFTGDFVFVGDVGRPDLLENAAGVKGTMEPGARALFQSLQRFKQLPDYVQIWPAHGAGSACGKGLGGVPFSTVGYERIANWGFAIQNEDEFVKAVLSGQPEPPRYFAVMKRVNKVGPAILGDRPLPALLLSEKLAQLSANGTVVLDSRSADSYRRIHLAKSINIPLNRYFSTAAGWLLPYDKPYYLIVNSLDDLQHALKELAHVGLDDCAGAFLEGALHEVSASGLGAVIPSVAADGVEPLLTTHTLLDVRGIGEFAGGRLAGAVHIPFFDLERNPDRVPMGKPLAVYCQTGNRSAIAASLLQRMGRTDVTTIRSGYPLLEKAGLPVES